MGTGPRESAQRAGVVTLPVLPEAQEDPPAPRPAPARGTPQGERRRTRAPLSLCGVIAAGGVWTVGPGAPAAPRPSPHHPLRQSSPAPRGLDAPGQLCRGRHRLRGRGPLPSPPGKPAPRCVQPGRPDPTRLLSGAGFCHRPPAPGTVLSTHAGRRGAMGVPGRVQAVQAGPDHERRPPRQSAEARRPPCPWGRGPGPSGSPLLAPHRHRGCDQPGSPGHWPPGPGPTAPIAHTRPSLGTVSALCRALGLPGGVSVLPLGHQCVAPLRQRPGSVLLSPKKST